VHWLAPVAAVAAVLAVVTGVSLAGRSEGQGAPSHQSPIPPEPVGTMPPFYVTLAATYPQNAPWAYVRDSANGAVLTAVHLPALVTNHGSSSPSITAGDNRTYIITESGPDSTGRTITQKIPPTPRYPHGRTVTAHVTQIVTVSRHYLLRAAADGRSASLTRLSIPNMPAATADIALSPDGSQVAAAVQPCQASGCPSTGIRVVTLATGAVRDWTTQVPGIPYTLSWAGNSHLAFGWVGTDSPGYGLYRLLDITRPGSNLWGARPIAGPLPMASGFTPPSLITPDGRAVITSAVRNIPDGNGRATVVAQIVELDARTGRLLRVLHTATARGTTGREPVRGQPSVRELDRGCKVLALGPTGVQALVECFGFGRLDGSRFTPLPGVPNPILVVGRAYPA
jgi:hypothetical protein